MLHSDCMLQRSVCPAENKLFSENTSNFVIKWWTRGPGSTPGISNTTANAQPWGGHKAWNTKPGRTWRKKCATKTRIKIKRKMQGHLPKKLHQIKPKRVWATYRHGHMLSLSLFNPLIARAERIGTEIIKIVDLND